MNKKKNNGLTLIEIMISVAIFSFVVGVTSVILVSSHNNLQIQRERIQALHTCRAVIEAIREKRKDFVVSNESFNWEGFYEWINEKTSNDWLSITTLEEHPIPIPDLQISVVLRNMNGEPAGGTNNPVQVFVTATWTSTRGHTIRDTVATILTSI
ncbi:MAG TPA: prepilin-type N-terminal cleavage/methylation domain-containing protein [Candidatus Hydrogenedens sp.]|nr:prepilin-type N-terminal cleavage/methylation domain-containing protein [Candidatus Hydrogenedens sp.]HOL20443.1 prepilin-type N-terminal cleavage/methylation domain-containing protein [Candidatus Hydrogenedens sp.]HPP57882.1 prepilin-type N-terminal cleavage/methylation domain-containing protein [Candidatus Hydrogenedens sp.]